jgi:HEPN domain-containing protein
MKRTTRQWVRKAEKDYLAAKRLWRGKDALHDQVCFFCQQSAEKYMKALHVEIGVAVPRTHVLNDLLALLIGHFPSLARWRPQLRFLTRFAVGTRYPGDNAIKRQADSALRSAGKVRSAIRGLLGL